MPLQSCCRYHVSLLAALKLAYRIPALAVGGAIATANTINELSRNQPCNTLKKHEHTEHSMETLSKAGCYCRAALIAAMFGIVKGCVYGRAWPVTVWQAHRLYQRVPRSYHEIVSPGYQPPTGEKEALLQSA